jgi:hypothetical protein
VPILGSVVTRPDWVVSALTRPVGGAGGSDLLPLLKTALTQVFETTLAVWTLLVSLLPISVGPLVERAWTWVFGHPVVVGAVLLLGAILLAVIERRRSWSPKDVRAERPLATRSREAVIRQTVVAGLGLWAVSVAPSLGVRALDLGEDAFGLALLAGVGLAGFALLAGVGYGTRQMLRTLYRALNAQHDRPGAPLGELVYRRIVGTIAGVAVLLVVAYTYLAVAEGQLIRVLRTFPAADPVKLAVLGLVVLLPPVLVALVFRAQLRTLVDAIADAVARRSVYAMLTARAARFPAVALVAVAGGSLAGPVGAVAAALGALVVTIAVQKAIRQARVRFADVGQVRRGGLRVRFAVRTVTDADGRQHFVVNVGSGPRDIRLAHPDRKRVLKDALATGVALAESGDAASGERYTRARWHADRLFGQGMADPVATAEALDEHARKALVETLRDEPDRRATEDRVRRAARQKNVPWGDPPGDELNDADGWGVERWIATRYVTREDDGGEASIRLLKDPWAETTGAVREPVRGGEVIG